MPSTVIRSFDYDPDARRLDIQFVTGRYYSYHDVPARIFAALRNVPSKEQFFNRRIRDHFAVTQKR